MKISSAFGRNAGGRATPQALNTLPAAGSLAAQNVTLAADGDCHLNEVVQIADHVSPFQLPLLARQTIFPFLAQQ